MAAGVYAGREAAEARCAAHEPLLEFGDRIEVAADPLAARLDFIDRYQARAGSAA